MNTAKIYIKSHICLLAFAAILWSCQSHKNEMPEGFEINPNFNLELVVSEPLIFDPVDMQFDENGRTYVLEMPGYPMEDVESRLVELIDSDNDGFYDQRQVMSENLRFATSFMPYKKGFLLASPPYLISVSYTHLTLPTIYSV